MIRVTRRGFLKISGLSIAATMASGLGFDAAIAKAQGYELKLEGCTRIPSICHFCSGGCGLLLHVKDGVLIHLDGDPDNPTNEGTLCPKAAGLASVAAPKDGSVHSHRPTGPKYRAPGASEWQDITWDEAIERIAKKLKEVRDETWVSTEEVTVNGVTAQVPVNRAEGIAVLGSAEVDNEESYLISKFSRLIGSPYNEHQARI